MSDHDTPLTPQEKKALSYAKDRRNDYRENDKASRKAIPLRKAREHRSDRRQVSQALAIALSLDEAQAELIESSARQDLNRVGGWRKTPDISLGDLISRQANRRQRQE
ncbi:hypothetical protein [Nitrospirillum viridazoti]|uniref:hypothetical protein n=1 Tax=Nitrospirillum viridazoti TaxID=3144925 RepID=UPI00110FB5EB|nr:hypothetical protein [Nitrospirillum amazonense]